jgi:hypothetical protein
MANFDPWEITNEGDRGTAHGKIQLVSSGWSGDVVKNDGTNNHFQFDVTGEGDYSNQHYTIDASGGYAFGGGGQIIGISLEHMGEITEISSGQETVQFLGMYNNSSNSLDFIPAWGALESDTDITVRHTDICVETITINENEYANRPIAQITLPYVYAGIRTLCDGNWYAVNADITIETDLPIFETDADLLAYCRSGGTDTSHILNPAEEPDPEEEYNSQFDFWFVKNKWGHNTRNVDSGSNTAKNYRFYPKRKGICFIKHTPTSSEPYDRILYNYSNYDPYYAAWGESADDDFVPNPGTLTTHFLTKSISFGPNDYYTKFDFDTNIPLWNTQQDADDYFNGLKDISEADNYSYIARQDNAILNPDLPGTDIDESTTLGTNGMRYSYGNRLYEITNVELSNLMTELYTPANVQDIIDGNKLFGSNTMEAVSGVIYIPLTSLDAVCDMGSMANVKIGSWTSQQAQGRRIIKNEGTIDCGTFFYNRVYNDYRDYEPYNLLFANLPFCGCHQLTISKYLDKTVGVSYNIDITTGAIVCKLTADGLLVDIFDGTCGASRPISATDNNAYINNVVGAITGASSQASGAIEGITNTVGVVGKAASAGSVAVAGAAVGGALGAGAAGAAGIYTAYQIKNAVDNPPQMHRGSLIGNLAYNLNTKPTFLFYSKRTIRPENELAVVGYPSGHGGTIGTFNGFLSCGAVKLANFNGTKTEESELFEILKGGIYI